MKPNPDNPSDLGKRVLAGAALLVVCGGLLAAQARWHFASVNPLVFSFFIVLALLYVGGPRYRRLPIIAHVAIYTAVATLVMLLLGAAPWVALAIPLTLFALFLHASWENMLHGGRAPRSTRRNDGASRNSVSLSKSGMDKAKPKATRWQTFLRVLRHSLLAPWHARAWHSDALQRAIRDCIARSERTHLGEIVVAIETRWVTLDIRNGMTPAQNARNRFAELGVWNTELNNGVLIHVTLAEQAIDLVADRGIASRVDAAKWQAIADSLALSCKQGSIQDGLLAAIESVGQLLHAHFPADADQITPNELGDGMVLT